jgi:hypothetical protein
MNLAATFPLGSGAQPQPAPALHAPCKQPGSAAAEDAAAESRPGVQEEMQPLCMQDLGPAMQQQAGSVLPIMAPEGSKEGQSGAGRASTGDGAELLEAAQALESLIDAVVESQLGLAEAKEGASTFAAALAGAGGSSSTPGLPDQAGCAEVAAASRDLAQTGGLDIAEPQQAAAGNGSSSLDSVDWERVRTAPVEEVRPNLDLLSGSTDAAVGPSFDQQVCHTRSMVLRRWQRPSSAVACTTSWRPGSR